MMVLLQHIVDLMTEISWNLLARINFHPTPVLGIDSNTTRNGISHSYHHQYTL